MSYFSAAEAKTRLDELLESAEYFPEQTPLLDEAKSNFVKAGTNLAEQAAPWLWAYYQSIYVINGPEDRKEYGIPEIANESLIWQHVTFYNPPVISVAEGAPYEPDLSYVSFEGGVTWEEEHGLQLVFSHGQAVCKVGPYDGHHTYARAYADEALVGVIFKG